MQSNPVSYSVAPSGPEQPVVSYPAAAPTARDHMERANESIRDSAPSVAEGIRQPIGRSSRRVSAGVAGGVRELGMSEFLLGRLDKYETVFVVDDSSTLTGEDWARVKTTLLQMVPPATLHNAAGGVSVYSASGESVWLRTREEVDNYVLSQMTQGAQSADVSDMARRALENRMGKVGEAGFLPLNLIVISNRLPDVAAEKAMAAASRKAHDAPAGRALRVQYCLTRDDAASRAGAEGFAQNFAGSHSLDDIFDCGTIPATLAMDRLIDKQLVGKIYSWSFDSVTFVQSVLR